MWNILSLNQPHFAWGRYLNALSLKVVQHFDSLTSHSRTRVFIVDDSVLRRYRSKKAELLARVIDHTMGRFTRGYKTLTLGESDGFLFASIDFVILRSAKRTNRFCEVKERLYKRTPRYKRRMEALSRKPDALMAFLDRALAARCSPDVVLIDSWFIQAPSSRTLGESYPCDWNGQSYEATLSVRQRPSDVSGTLCPFAQKQNCRNSGLVHRSHRMRFDHQTGLCSKP
jgi:hypothetical protein